MKKKNRHREGSANTRIRCVLLRGDLARRNLVCILCFNGTGGGSVVKCVNALQLRVHRAKARASENPGIPGLVPAFVCFDLNKHCTGEQSHVTTV